METKFDKKTPTDGLLTIEINKEDVQPEITKKLKEYSKTAKVKGFRPGHVPLGYVQKLYGKSVLVDEVINKVSKTVNEYIVENKLKVVGDPMPDEASKAIDWETSDNFVFNYEVGLASDFKIDIDKLPAIETFDIKPSEDQINKSIEDIQKRFGDDLEPEEAEIGDLVFGTLKQESSDFESKCGIPTDKVTEKAKKMFLGLEKGSEIQFDIKTLFDEVKALGFAIGKSDKEAEALSGEFDFVVDKISRITPAKINQELFDKVLGPDKASNEDEFRIKLSELIKENYNRETDLMLDFDIDKLLVDNIKIDLPDEFLKKWLLAINEGKVTEEDIEKEFDAFTRGLRLDLIKSEIAQENEIKVEYPEVLEEVKAEIRNYFSQGGSAGFEGMEDFIDNMAKQQLKENKDNAFRKYYNIAFGRAVVNFLKDKVKIDNKEVFVEDFNEIAKKKYEVA